MKTVKSVPRAVPVCTVRVDQDYGKNKRDLVYAKSESVLRIRSGSGHFAGSGEIGTDLDSPRQIETKTGMTQKLKVIMSAECLTINCYTQFLYAVIV